MAVTMRKGKYVDFDPSKMRAGEWAVVLADDPGAKDGKSIYICFSAGNVKRMSTYEDMVDNIESASKDIRDMFTEDIREKIRQATVLINEGNTFITNSRTIIEEAKEAAQKANDAAADIRQKAANGEFSATISRVSAVTGEAGTQAKVENTGTAKDANLVFTIPKGEAAGFGMPVATVDANVGVPSVTVTASGSDTEKVFRFEFHNLKGEPGAEGTIDENSTVAFSRAETRENIQSGETLVILMGKIEKIFSDLKNIAYTASYADLVDVPYDFIGTKQELQEAIESGQVYEGMTVYLTDVGYALEYNGAVTTILEKNLDPDKVLVSDADGKIAASELKSSVLSFLSGITSDVQDQINKIKNMIENLEPGGISVGNVKNLELVNSTDNLELSWSDPDNIVFNGEAVAEWDGTKVVRKEGSAPESVSDGILIADSKIKDQYAAAGLQDVDLAEDINYHYALFPYTKKNVYTMSDLNRISGKLKHIYDPILANNTWSDIAKASRDDVAKEFWNVGDVKDDYIIMGFDHDDLSDGSGKAGITFMCDGTSRTLQDKYSSNYTFYAYPNNSYVQNNLNALLSSKVPLELRGLIRKVNKLYQTAKAMNSNVAIAQCFLFIPSAWEVAGEPENASKQGHRYSGNKTTGYTYWTRTNVSSGGTVTVIQSNGNTYNTTSTDSYWYRYGFCL